MVRAKLRGLSLTVIIGLVPILLLAAPVAASPSADECAGGIDASDDQMKPTPLEVLGGCKGKLYNAFENSTHKDDFTDTYGLRISGSGTSKIHFQLCNKGEGALFYEVFYRTDLLTLDRIASWYVMPGECSSDQPVEMVGGYKPGNWKFLLYTYDAEIPEGTSMNYWMYVQPLWR